MKCHILFSEKNKKNISKCRLLKILPRVLSVKSYPDEGGDKEKLRAMKRYTTMS